MSRSGAPFGFAGAAVGDDDTIERGRGTFRAQKQPRRAATLGLPAGLSYLGQEYVHHGVGDGFAY